MHIKLKKLFNGYGSVRDYLIKMAVANREDLVLEYKDDKMVVPLKVLANPDKFQIHKTKFQSKFHDSQTYELYDFKFVPNANLQPKLPL